MTRPGLFVHAVRSARPRQLRARALRPLRRRRFPDRPGGGARPVETAVALWRSPAFALADEVAGSGSVRVLGLEVPYPPPDWALPGVERLRRFHLHYGEEILGWSRRGDVAAAAAGLAAWIGENPPRPGDAWHPYPLSTRVGNWIAALSLEPSLATGEVAQSLRRQLAYLERNVEDDVLGNHVIRNARALVLGGRALGDRELLRRGVELLRREVPEQVLSDGGHYERSPVYHLVVLRDLLEARAAAEQDWLDEPIERMRRFAAGMRRPDGLPAPFNDAPFELAPDLDLPGPEPGTSVFEETGYVVVREGAVWLAFDCGPPSPPFLPAHAHADALSFQLWVGGEPVVVDPGTSTYEPGSERNYERSTRAHATATVDGREQFETWGAFRTGALPAVRLVSASPLTGEVSYDGIRHRRRIDLTELEVVVADEVSGDRPVESRLPLARTLDVAVDAWESGWISERLYERRELPVAVRRGSGAVEWRLSQTT